MHMQKYDYNMIGKWFVNCNLKIFGLNSEKINLLSISADQGKLYGSITYYTMLNIFYIHTQRDTCTYSVFISTFISSLL